MAAKLKVSQSKVKTWRKCRQAYHFKYVEKLRKRQISRPFKFGGIVHEMLEADANGDDPFKILEKIAIKDAKLFRKERELYGEIIEDIRTIMTAYFDYWDPNAMVPLRKNKRSAEHEFEIDIARNIIFTGKIDAVVKTPKNGLKWLGENKTFTHLPNEDHRWRNLQSAVYFKAIDAMGWWDDLAGVCWNYVCSKAPTRPQIKKDKTLSTRHINTFPSVIEKVIEENNLKRSKYKDMITKAESNYKNYFIRIFTPVNHSVVDLVYEGFVDTAKEIAQYHGTKKDKNIDRHCDFCDYEKICRAELTGNDVKFIKEREYTHEEKPREEKERSE